MNITEETGIMSAVTQAKRIVVKVGTSTLTYENGKLQIQTKNLVTEKKATVSINKVKEGASDASLKAVAEQLKEVLADPVEKVTVVQTYEIQ